MENTALGLIKLFLFSMPVGIVLTVLIVYLGSKGRQSAEAKYRKKVLAIGRETVVRGARYLVLSVRKSRECYAYGGVFWGNNGPFVVLSNYEGDKVLGFEDLASPTDPELRSFRPQLSSDEVAGGMAKTLAEEAQ